MNYQKLHGARRSMSMTGDAVDSKHMQTTYVGRGIQAITPWFLAWFKAVSAKVSTSQHKFTNFQAVKKENNETRQKMHNKRIQIHTFISNSNDIRLITFRQIMTPVSGGKIVNGDLYRCLCTWIFQHKCIYIAASSIIHLFHVNI